MRRYLPSIITILISALLLPACGGGSVDATLNESLRTSTRIR